MPLRADGAKHPFTRLLYALLARLSASSSAARSSVTPSTVSPRRRLAFVSPSVTYGPKRPSLTTIGLPVAGSAPSSRSGGFAAPRPAARCGCASSASASSSVTVKSCSSLSSERDSLALLHERPVAAVLRR